MKEKATSITSQRSPEARIIAAIPCHNEERFIGSVVLKTRNFVDLVIVVDDGSSDRTAEVAEAGGALVLKHEANKGKGVAINTAFDKAKELGAEAVVLLDGDDQHDPADIPSLLKPVLDGQADMVVGSRFLHNTGHTPWYRRIGQRVLTRATNFGSRSSLTDSQSGFRAFSQRALNTLRFQQARFSVESEMQFLARDKNLKMFEVPLVARYEDKVKRSPVAHGVGVLGRILELIAQRRPLIFFSIPGVLLIVSSITIGSMVVRRFNDTDTLPVGFTLLAVLLGTVGTLAVFTGIILNAISRSGLGHKLED